MEYPKRAELAPDDVAEAPTAIGKGVEVSRLTQTVTGKVRYGFQSVKLRVSVVDHGDSRSLVQIQPFSDDIWAGGARKGTDKFFAPWKPRPRAECFRTGHSERVNKSVATTFAIAVAADLGSLLDFFRGPWTRAHVVGFRWCGQQGRVQGQLFEESANSTRSGCCLMRPS